MAGLGGGLNVASAPPPPPRPGWYRDPEGGKAQRYFDGTNWTNKWSDPKKLADTELHGKAILVIIAVLAQIFIANRSGDSDTDERGKVLPQPQLRLALHRPPSISAPSPAEESHDAIPRNGTFQN
jgi:hypothetical protein